jgi:hypothetical protein
VFERLRAWTGGHTWLAAPVAAALFVVIETWPTGILLALAGGVWLFARKREDFWAKPLASLAGPIALGLGVLTFLLLVLNLTKGSLRPEHVVALQDRAASVHFGIKRWTSLSWTELAMLSGWLLAMGAALSERLFSHVLTAKKWIGRAATMSATVGSFVLSAQIPASQLITEAVEDVRTDVRVAESRYEFDLKQQAHDRATLAAANAIAADLPKLSPAEIEQLAAMMSALQHDRTRWTAYEFRAAVFGMGVTDAQSALSPLMFQSRKGWDQLMFATHGLDETKQVGGHAERVFTNTLNGLTDATSAADLQAKRQSIRGALERHRAGARGRRGAAIGLDQGGTDTQATTATDCRPIRPRRSRPRAQAERDSLKFGTDVICS